MNKIIDDGGTCAVIKADVSIENEFESMIKTIIQADGELSYLVNNAGITKDKLAMRMSIEDFSSVIDANLLSTFIGCKLALKNMSKARFGSVVNISSVVGQMGNAGQCNYSASKGGIDALTKSFAKEGGSRSIRFNSIAPGFIKTAMTDKLSDEVMEKYLVNIPLKRLGEASEVASVVSFLLSDASSYISGDVLKVNGALYT
jgi:3-oxoacyl-[acyl-carrier protein] reductase